MYLVIQIEWSDGGDQVSWTWLLSSTTADNAIGEPSWSKSDYREYKYIFTIKT